MAIVVDCFVTCFIAYDAIWEHLILRRFATPLPEQHLCTALHDCRNLMEAIIRRFAWPFHTAQILNLSYIALVATLRALTQDVITGKRRILAWIDAPRNAKINDRQNLPNAMQIWSIMSSPSTSSTTMIT